MNPHKFILVLSFFSFFSCGSMTEDFKWPEEWPSDMSLSMYYYGGMTPESWKMLITKDSCVYEKNYGQRKQKYTFRIEQKELNGLMNVLKENNITKMKMKEHGVIHDKATSGFTFKYGEKEYRISPGATESLEEKWWPNFRAINDAAEKIFWDRLNTQKKDFIIQIDPSVQKSGKRIAIIFDFSEISFDYPKDSIPSEVKVNLLPGEYEVQIHLLNEGKYGSDMYFASWMQTLNTAEKKGAVLKLVDGKLVVESSGH